MSALVTLNTEKRWLALALRHGATKIADTHNGIRVEFKDAKSFAAFTAEIKDFKDAVRIAKAKL